MAENITMETKKILAFLKAMPYYLVLSLLTVGASLILGLLSFSGMYALMPLLSLAFATFFLSVAYEGEIYLQNLKGALAKLFKPNYLENHLAKEYLLNHLPDNLDKDDCPQFFKDYKAQLHLLAEFDDKELNKESKRKKKQIAKTLKDMEHWFAKQLFAEDKNKALTPYAQELQQWLAEHGQKEWQEKLEKRSFSFNHVKVFSTLSAFFMGLGSTYLMVEAFAAIPLLAAIPFGVLPLIILPLAVIAGAAYGLLTYNSITNLINNNTVVKWFNKLKADLQQGWTARNVFMAATAAFLALLAVGLTICTAGTWWTIASNARPLFEWMRKMPSFIMGIINPIITGISAIAFNIQNSAESLEMVDEALRSDKTPWRRAYEYLVDAWKNIRATENWLQIANPFRLLLKLTITPLRIMLFLGHLVSIALTSDRMPGLPQIIAALIAIISEGFEDAHYFIVGSSKKATSANTPGQDDQAETKALLEERVEGETEHSNGVDIPTWLLQTAAAPIYALAAAWDSLTSQLNPQNGSSKRPISFAQAWNKQRGIAPEENFTPSPQSARPSSTWRMEHALSLIDQQKEHLTQATTNPELAKEKIANLNNLKTKVLNEPKTIGETLEQEKKNPVYNKHRIFAFTEQTTTQEFIEDLPERVGAAACTP